MKRTPFSQVLKNASIDLRREYDRLYAMFYLQHFHDETGIDATLKEYCGFNFANLPFRGTCISLDDFDDFYDYSFEKSPKDFDINYLVSFCEYSYNLAIYNQSMGFTPFQMNMARAAQFYLQQVMKVMETVGHMANTNDGITDFVPKDQAAISVSEIVDSNLSYKVIEYNHYSMKGDLERKKATLLVLADKLEPQRSTLKNANPSLEDDLFFLFNNVNLRHNNADPQGKKYSAKVAAMGETELEQWYDDTYQMCLLAFLELDHIERKARVKQLKTEIQK